MNWAWSTNEELFTAGSDLPSTKPKPVDELNGLVYGATVLPKEEPVPFYKSEWMWATVAIAIFVALNIYFW